MEKMKDLKFNCTRCGSGKFEVIGNFEKVPISLTMPVEYKDILRYTIRCADCKNQIGSMKPVIGLEMNDNGI